MKHICQPLITATVLTCLLTQFTFAQAPTVKTTPADKLFEPAFRGSHSHQTQSNFRLNLDYTVASSVKNPTLMIGKGFTLPLPSGNHKLQLNYQQTENAVTSVSIWMDGEKTISNKVVSSNFSPSHFHKAKLGEFSLNDEFTLYTEFSAKGDGTLFMRHFPNQKWKPNGKVLGISDGKLLFDVGWVGAIKSNKKINDGKTHRAVIRTHKGAIQLFLDGKLVGTEKKLKIKDTKGHLFQVGHGTDFIPDLMNGKVSNIRYWNRSLNADEVKNLIGGQPEKVNTPDKVWSPQSPAKPKSIDWLSGSPVKLTLSDKAIKVQKATIQPLDKTPHAKLIANFNAKSLAEGKNIYHSLCATCHGDKKKEGSLPTATRFHKGVFKNGSDPYRMFKTLERGYGMMMAQPQYTAEQKYAVIHYIRETFLKNDNPSQYTKLEDNYLDSLPLGIHQKTKKVIPKKAVKPYLAMDFGPYMMGTFQIDNNIANTAQKGILIRLDKGLGGVSKGKNWILYDHDTMRVASMFSEDFINWKTILFDGSHGTHMSITGKPLLTNDNLPAWQNPETGDWNDLRITGRDGRRYGPLPKSWINYKGLYVNGDNVIVHYSVGTTDVKEKASVTKEGTFSRQFSFGPRKKELITRIAGPDSTTHFSLSSAAKAKLKKSDKGTFLHISKGAAPFELTLFIKESDKPFLPLKKQISFKSLLNGGTKRYPQELTLEGSLGDTSGPFSIDEIPIPQTNQNPWNAWLRIGGFDFFPNNPDRAAVCTWQGDVWLVSGVSGNLDKVTWKRIASGLFQPLGLKIVEDKIYVTCRDQIALLHDLNNDEEIDYIESFNHDHQVTEHFHEFAMGLQTDEEGNFYYAKSARHAKKAVVPHHGTLLKVSKDGSTTEIIANGFRAANGVCLNPDGTWIVTDQEGHWNPKNRINYVKKGGFYGNMYGYHSVTDSSDSAMEKPLCWITNAFDRSPAELIWVPKDAGWGTLNGTLLNLSYGYGTIYTVPHEIVDGQAQGGMCALPLPKTKSGIHRGRFHPTNKQLYGVGMFAWAGSQREDAGFYRIRRNDKAALMPIATKARKGEYTVTFSEPVPTGTTVKIKAWDLKRTKSYGSRHYNERELKVEKITVQGNDLILKIDQLTITRGLEIKCTFPNGESRVIHASINKLK